MTTDTTATLVQASEKPSDTDQEAKGWRTAIASALGLTVGPSVLTVMSFGAFIAPLHREFGWSVSAIGRAASVLSITVMIISPLQGYLVDRYGGRRVILWSSPVFGLSL
ncbi:MFS transporter, partial [Streptomyces sp. SID11233]|nr:MFS transporter [Streptomyces sp. SID11233]